MVPNEVWIIVLIMFLVLIFLVVLYLRFQRYRREKMRDFKRVQDRARKEGIKVPDEVAKAMMGKDDPKKDRH